MIFPASIYAAIATAAGGALGIANAWDRVATAWNKGEPLPVQDLAAITAGGLAIAGAAAAIVVITGGTGACSPGAWLISKTG